MAEDDPALRANSHSSVGCDHSHVFHRCRYLRPLPHFRKLRQWNLLLGFLIIIFGYATAGTRIETSLLLPLGLMPVHFISVDYFPLLPWFGVVLIGSAVADFVYIRKGCPGIPFTFPKIQRTKLGALGNLMNRHALIVYLVHQPVILLILMLILGKPAF